MSVTTEMSSIHPGLFAQTLRWHHPLYNAQRNFRCKYYYFPHFYQGGDRGRGIVGNSPKAAGLSCGPVADLAAASPLFSPPPCAAPCSPRPRGKPPLDPQCDTRVSPQLLPLSLRSFHHVANPYFPEIERAIMPTDVITSSTASKRLLDKVQTLCLEHRLFLTCPYPKPPADTVPRPFTQ